MASEKDFELLDQYVGNRLNAEEKASFEKKLEADAELRKEVKLQQQIVEGIRKQRTLELKKMLNDIPLSSIPNEGPSLLTQIGLWVVVAGFVGTGLYFYFNQEESVPPQPAVEEVVKEQNTIEEPAAEEPETKSEQPSQVEGPVAAQPKNSSSETPKAKSPEQAEEKPVQPSTLDVFDPNEDADASDKVNTETEKAKSASAPSIIVETQVDKRYNFHYQFKDDKLYLYGSFEKNLYEIMEFFSDNKRTMFLFL